MGGKRTIKTHEALVTNRSCDYVVMNPPFVAATNHEGGREYAVPPFALFGITPEDQRAMAALLKPMYAGTCSHGNAGLGSYFVAIADKKIKPGGVIGLILPSTVMSGASWDGVRRMLNEWYDDIMLVQVGLSVSTSSDTMDTYTNNTEKKSPPAPKNARDWGNTYSSDTGMNEVILVARRRHNRRATGNAPPRIKLILLDTMPHSRLEALETARIVRSTRLIRLEDGAGHTSIVVGKNGVTGEGNIVGRGVNCPVDDGRWWVGRVSNVYLLHVVYEVAHSGIGDTSMVTLGNMCQIGKIARDINGTEDKGDGTPRGPFNKVPIVHADADVYTSLWNNNVSKQMTMLVPPDCALEPRHNCIERAKEIWKTASRLHVNLQVDYRSQRLIAAFTMDRTLGGSAWPNVIIDEKYEKALAVWCNSTLGVLMYFITSASQQRGRGRMSKTALATLPVPNFHMMNDMIVSKLDKLFDEYMTREMLPVNYVEQDTVRIELDTHMSDILDIKWDLAKIRTKLVHEKQFGRSDL